MKMALRLIVVFALVAIAFLFLHADPLSAQLKKVRLSAPTVAITELPFKIAQHQGFYREQGLEVEIIVIRGALGVTALVAGSVDYSTASGSIIVAAARGIGVKLVYLMSAKPAFDLVAEPRIRSLGQLRGKIVGISSRGGSVDLLTRLMLEKNGLNPDKDVVLLVVGTPEEMMIALRAGRISAALLSPPRQLMLYREGFNNLGFSGDYLSTYMTGGIGTTNEKIRRSPDEVLAFIRGSLKGVEFYKKNRNESIKMISKELRISDPVLAGQVYDLHAGRLSRNGMEDESWMKGAIEFTKKSLDISDKNIPPDHIFDFSFIEKALR